MSVNKSTVDYPDYKTAKQLKYGVEERYSFKYLFSKVTNEHDDSLFYCRAIIAETKSYSRYIVRITLLQEHEEQRRQQNQQQEAKWPRS